jgi:hypothetical protein
VIQHLTEAHEQLVSEIVKGTELFVIGVGPLNEFRSEEVTD